MNTSRSNLKSVKRTRTGAAVLALLATASIAGCATIPERVAVSPPRPAPDTRVFFYPVANRPTPSADQQNRDRYECNDWAVTQSHFDPSNPSAVSAPVPIIVDRGPPAGTGTLIGATSGAIVGAAVSNPWHAGRGTLIGALAGAAIGTVADTQRRDATEQNAVNAQASSNSAAVSRAATDYKRAMTACLEGRGYRVT